jgi:WhiB family redox-sensing transcriptional regulator
MAQIHPEPVNWREIASCKGVDGDVFFPASEDLQGINAAKEICSACSVADECLSYAIETNQTEGIWGGMTARQRRRLRRSWLEEQRKAS